MPAARGICEIHGRIRRLGQPHKSPEEKPTLIEREQSDNESGIGSMSFDEAEFDGPGGTAIEGDHLPIWADDSPTAEPEDSQFVSNATVSLPSMPPSLASSSLPPTCSPPMNSLWEEPRFAMKSLAKYSPLLKKIIWYTPSKMLAALFETDDEAEIAFAKDELLEDFALYDGRSNVPISNCSMRYLSTRGIEYLTLPCVYFPFASYYCTICDYYIEDLNTVEDHLPTHMKEEKRLRDRRTLPDRLPPPAPAQLAAVERVLLAAAVHSCSPEREASLRASAQAAMQSLRELCLSKTQFNGVAKDVRVSQLGSLVSGLLTDHSDINLSLSVHGESAKYFVKVLAAMDASDEWSGVKLCESPTRLYRIEGVFEDEKVTIDWRNDEGVRISQLLSCYNRLHEDVLPLRQIVRKWAEMCDLTTAEKLSSKYAVPPVLLDVMLIHELQQTKRLPCLNEVLFGTSKDVADHDVKEILAHQSSSIRWNIAEVFLDFLLYFSRGDSKRYLIQITSTEKTLKRYTSFHKKQVHVMDPIRDRPIAYLNKTFQIYFINCFLTTYLHFRIPRTRSRGDCRPTALVNVEVYQTMTYFALPLEKKTKSNVCRTESDQKKEGAQNETPGSSDAAQPAATPEVAAAPASEKSDKEYAMNNKNAPAPAPRTLFLDELYDRSLLGPAPTLVPSSRRKITVAIAPTRMRMMEDDDAVVEAMLVSCGADFLIGMHPTDSVWCSSKRTSRTPGVAHVIRVSAPRARLVCVVAMHERCYNPPFTWQVDETSDEGAAVCVDVRVSAGGVDESEAGLRLMVGVERSEEGMQQVVGKLQQMQHALAIGAWQASDLSGGMSRWRLPEKSFSAFGKGMTMEGRETGKDGVALLTMSIGKPIVINDKLLDEKQPADLVQSLDNTAVMDVRNATTTGSTRVLAMFYDESSTRSFDDNNDDFCMNEECDGIMDSPRNDRRTPPPSFFSGFPSSPSETVESCLVIVEEQRHHMHSITCSPASSSCSSASISPPVVRTFSHTPKRVNWREHMRDMHKSTIEESIHRLTTMRGGIEKKKRGKGGFVGGLGARRAHRPGCAMHVWSLVKHIKESSPDCNCKQEMSGVSNDLADRLRRLTRFDSRITERHHHKFTYSYKLEYSLPSISEERDDSTPSPTTSTSSDTLVRPSRPVMGRISRSVSPPPSRPHCSSPAALEDALQLQQPPVLSEEEMCARLSALPIGYHTTATVAALENALHSSLSLMDTEFDE